METVERERERGKGERGSTDRDAKSFRDRDAVAFNGLYVICELGVGVARRAKKLKVLQCLLPMLLLRLQLRLPLLLERPSN